MDYQSVMNVINSTRKGQFGINVVAGNSVYTISEAGKCEKCKLEKPGKYEGDKADIKKHAVPFVIGVVVLFGSSGILAIIANFASNIKVQ